MAAEVGSEAEFSRVRPGHASPSALSARILRMGSGGASVAGLELPGVCVHVCVCALLVVVEVGVDTGQGAQGRMVSVTRSRKRVVGLRQDIDGPQVVQSSSPVDRFSKIAGGMRS